MVNSEVTSPPRDPDEPELLDCALSTVIFQIARSRLRERNLSKSIIEVPVSPFRKSLRLAKGYDNTHNHNLENYGTPDRER